MQIFVPDFTPMYAEIWTSIANYYATASTLMTEYRVISMRLGAASSKYHDSWHHICHPRILYNSVQKGNKYASFDLTWGHACFNPVVYTRCRNCNYVLTKKEIVLIKLALLDMSR